MASWLPWLWLAGSPITFAWLALGLAGAERLRRRSVVSQTASCRGLCRRLAGELGIARVVAVAVCDRLAAPVLVGIVRPLILLPAAALGGWAPDQLEMVLLHELAHVRRWDNLVNLVQRLVESVLFFHPAVWLVSGWLRREREHCCDAVVVAHTGRARAYAETLLALAVPEHGSDAAHGRRHGPESPGLADSPHPQPGSGGTCHEAASRAARPDRRDPDPPGRMDDLPRPSRRPAGEGRAQGTRA